LAFRSVAFSGVYGMKMENGPLTGVKVLDLSLLLPGPLCSQHLADMGAEVIKVENPRMGDLTRYMSTKVTKGDFAESGIFLQLNRNKSSITVNIKREGGRDVIMRLLKDCDILLEGFRPDTLNELGIGLRAAERKISATHLLCHFGLWRDRSHYKEHAGHDANYIARAGLLALNGVKGGPPIVPGFQVADIGGGTLDRAGGNSCCSLCAREDGPWPVSSTFRCRMARCPFSRSIPGRIHREW
jgi:alpha-methylacyl-CoA racemase